jgi:hypothetical protein
MVGVSSLSSQKYPGIGIKISLDFSETIWYYRNFGTYEATKA